MAEHVERDFIARPEFDLDVDFPIVVAVVVQGLLDRARIVFAVFLL